ncbi:hypothetical protein F4811DRAFT_558365 [Daldinia bambusicola]|nr:hypothetical protein F4811DRAFT_558365 [Daldinia bambusicola]
MKQLLTYLARFTTARRAPLVFRTYATSPKAQSTQGRASPGTASNVAPGNATPSSASSDEQHIKTKRATGGSAASPDSASVAQPVSDPGASGLGRQEEEHGGAADAMKQDPGKPDEEKRKKVEDMGNIPLDKGDG